MSPPVLVVVIRATVRNSLVSLQPKGARMLADRFDALTQSLTVARSRRHAFAVTLGGVLSALGCATTEAKKKKKCLPCKKRKQGKCKGAKPDGAVCAGGTCQSGRCVPASPGPVTTADAACLSKHTSFSGHLRNAQTFRALRSGQLTSASVELYHNDEGADFDMEIWSVNAANEPSAVLAGTTIANVPATIPPGPRTLTGSFAAPATVVAGIRYALVIAGRVNQSSGIYGLPADECPDGIWFFATTPSGAFTASPGNDLGFATFVTA